VARDAAPVGHVSVTGGEPLLRTDLPEIISAWAEAGIRSLSLRTNGAMRARVEAVLERVLQRHARLRITVTVSVDGPAVLHDRLRGVPGLYARVEESLDGLQRLARHHPQLRVHACITVSADNLHAVTETYGRLARWNLDAIELNRVRGVTADPLCGGIPAATYEAAAAALPGSGAGGLSAVFRQIDRAMRRVVAEPHAPWPCGPCLAGRRLAVIRADGSVLPCEMLGDEALLGHLAEFDYGLRALLGTPKARRQVDRIGRGECRCSFECAIFATLVYRPWRLGTVWWSGRVSARGRRHAALRAASGDNG
jgi:MoaA/NifB/PqqE/SkfB family radical SAM enzyme